MTEQAVDSKHHHSSIDSSELAERISEALEPALDDVAERVAEAVARKVSESGGFPGSDALQKEEPKVNGEMAETASVDRPQGDESAGEPDSNGDREARPRGRSTAKIKRNGKDKPEGESLFGRLTHTLISSITGTLREEGGEHLEMLADNAVEKLFSVRVRGWVRDLADRTLQSTLYGALNSMHDPPTRYKLYRDSLSRLRPIVRQAVDAMYTDDNKETLRQQLRGAIPSVVDGDLQSASTMLAPALSEITDDAQAALWDNSWEIFQVLRHISTVMLQESFEHSVEDKVDAEAIQEKVQSKVDEAREKLLETVEKLQEGVKEAQSQLQERTGATSGRGRQAAAPSGSPPSGVPPFGQPPWGTPPSGMPPNGFPPSGVPPAVERRQKAAHSSRGSNSRH